MALRGPAVALAGQEHQLAAVWHAGNPDYDSESQNLGFAIYDAQSQQAVDSGSLLLSAKSTLTWLGFTKEGRLAAADSTGVVRVRSSSVSSSA